jgi:hypothetical protein
MITSVIFRLKPSIGQLQGLPFSCKNGIGTLSNNQLQEKFQPLSATLIVTRGTEALISLQNYLLMVFDSAVLAIVAASPPGSISGLLLTPNPLGSRSAPTMNANSSAFLASSSRIGPNLSLTRRNLGTIRGR